VPVVAQSKYRAPMFCSNAHLQTIAPNIFRKAPDTPYRRERIETPDGDFLDLDWSQLGSRRIAIVVHGLEGDSSRAYIKGMVKAVNRRGWDAMAMNLRGCGGEPNRKVRMYHSGDTADLQTVISHVAASGDYDQIVLVGFSLGGNAILKYLGEQGCDILGPVKAAVTISVPCDLTGCSVCLGELRNRLYLLRFLKLLGRKIKAKARMMPGAIDAGGYDSIRTLREFDNRYTAPMHGFKDADDYYEKSSSLRFIPSISIPTLLINSSDDPFLSASCFPVEAAKNNPNFFLEVTKHGGHVGFMTFNQDGEYWSETRAASFLEEKV
jgi:predicted alpha/beta-fold hydrolase